MSFGPPDLCLIVGSSGYALTVSVDWMGVVEAVILESFAVMGVTIGLSTTRHSNLTRIKLEKRLIDIAIEHEIRLTEQMID